MRARFTRQLPALSHPRFSSAPDNAGRRETFNQVTMTECLRRELDLAGFEDFHFEASRRHTGDDGEKGYQFDLHIPGTAEDVTLTWCDSFDGEIWTECEFVEDGATFAGDEPVPHSAIAAVGNIVS